MKNKTNSAITPTASACRDIAEKIWALDCVVAMKNPRGPGSGIDDIAAVILAFVEERELRAKIELCLQMEEQKWTASAGGMVKYTVQWLQELQAQLAARQQGEGK